MFSLPTTRGRRLGSSLLSVAVHVSVAAVCMLSVRLRPVKVFTLAGKASGTRIALTYLPGEAPNVARNPEARTKPRTVPFARVAKARIVEAAPVADSPSTSSAPGEISTGSDSWGTGSIQIALTTFSPSPAPDLSVLPHGIQGDVVVDVTIDPTGKVADLAVLHSLGYGIESSVIGTLKTWTFRPATKDGSPIASVQELHFHFGPV